MTLELAAWGPDEAVPPGAAEEPVALVVLVEGRGLEKGFCERARGRIYFMPDGISVSYWWFFY